MHERTTSRSSSRELRPPVPPPAGGPPRDVSAEVIDAFVSLAGSLVSGHDPNDLLTHLVERAVHLLDLDAAGILLADRGGRLQLAAASSDVASHLELLALSSDDGPCLVCFATGSPVVAVGRGDVEAGWPAFAAAMRDHGLVGVVALPLRLRDQTLGTLGMFSRTWDSPGAGVVRIAQGLADVASISLVHQRALDDARTLTSQLQTALDSRVLIEQAKGVIAVQLGTSIDDAFHVLRSTARRRGSRLADLAADLVNGRTDASHLEP